MDRADVLQADRMAPARHVRGRAADLAPRVSAGRGGRTKCEGECGRGAWEKAGRELLLAAEDNVCDSTRPRLEAANRERVHVVERLRDHGFVGF